MESITYQSGHWGDNDEDRWPHTSTASIINLKLSIFMYM